MSSNDKGFKAKKRVSGFLRDSEVYRELSDRVFGETDRIEAEERKNSRNDLSSYREEFEEEIRDISA